MTRSLNRNSNKNKLGPLQHAAEDYSMTVGATEIPRAKAAYPGMRLIPWSDIWTSVKVGRLHGNGEMIELFYDTLFKEAVFDDRGAWSLDLSKRN